MCVRTLFWDAWLCFSCLSRKQQLLRKKPTPFSSCFSTPDWWRSWVIQLAMWPWGGDMFHCLWWFCGDYNSLSVTFPAMFCTTWVTNYFRCFCSVEDVVLAQWSGLLLSELLSVLDALCPSFFHLLSPHMLVLFPKLHFTFQLWLTCARAWLIDPAKAQGRWKILLQAFALCSFSYDFSF